MVEDKCNDYKANEDVDSDWYPPFSQVINLVSTAASVRRSSDAASVERKKVMCMLMLLLDSLMMDNQVCEFDVSSLVMLSDEVRNDPISVLTSIQAHLCYSTNNLGYEMANPPSRIDMESCSGVEATASCVNVEELQLKAQSVVLPSCRFVSHFSRTSGLVFWNTSTVNSATWKVSGCNWVVCGSITFEQHFLIILFVKNIVGGSQYEFRGTSEYLLVLDHATVSASPTGVSLQLKKTCPYQNRRTAIEKVYRSL